MSNYDILVLIAMGLTAAVTGGILVGVMIGTERERARLMAEFDASKAERTVLRELWRKRYGG